jgi:hypothetical protein
MDSLVVLKDNKGCQPKKGRYRKEMMARLATTYQTGRKRSFELLSLLALLIEPLITYPKRHRPRQLSSRAETSK